MPAIHGYKLNPPDRIENDDTPVCCQKVMTHKGSRDEYQVYECGGCGTVLAIDPDDLIYVIKEG
ncbi:MAG: hypothetical protein HOW97_09465 [Catenulispora sp.]|nr:hypothetical protein [Catenulispora sp.]